MRRRAEILAYLAGLIDGEAYIGIKKCKPYKHLTGNVNPSYHERIQVRMVERGGLTLLCKTLGGWLYKEKANVERGRPLWCYQASDLKAANICAVLLPWLRVKRIQAEAVLELRKSRKKAKREWRTHKKSTIALRERLYLRVKKLNKVGV